MKIEFILTKQEMDLSFLEKLRAMLGDDTEQVTISITRPKPVKTGSKNGKPKPKPDFAKMTTYEILEAYPEYAKEIDARIQAHLENPESGVKFTLDEFQKFKPEPVLKNA
jgi:hypothetical protein